MLSASPAEEALMFPSTMSLPEQHLKLIHAHQRELRAEAARLVAGRFATGTNHQDNATVGAHSSRRALAGVAARVRATAAGWGILHAYWRAARKPW